MPFQDVPLITPRGGSRLAPDGAAQPEGWLTAVERLVPGGGLDA